MKFRTRFLRGRWLPLLLLPMAATADTVHVYTQRDLNGSVTQLADATVDTGTTYTPAAAANVNGYIFTGWTISANQTFVTRDHYGRALETVSFTVYECVTNTAHYLPTTTDTDKDGLPDGWELYWFGNLDAAAADDTDGDGYTHVVERALGTNPHLVNRKLRHGVLSTEGGVVQYNPDGIAQLTIRSEPEGVLFKTTREYVKAGTTRSTSSYNPNNSTFAYWSFNGTRQADARGRALDSVSFTMPTNDLEVVAYSISDATARKVAYWYGDDTALSSDTDGDGYTLAVELALGTNPLLPNRKFRHGVLSTEGATVQYNPDSIHRYTIRSEPAGVLFATQSDYARQGTVLTTPSCNCSSTKFAYWTINGVRQADHRGRALDRLSFTMTTNDMEAVAVCIDDVNARKVAYWYGDDTALSSDTDGDGYTLAVELALGMNPLVVNRKFRQGIISASGETRELNLQVYEQVRGALVDDAYSELFTSSIAGNGATSRTFAGGTQIWPVVADVNGDGLWDLVVCSAATTNIFINCGSKGNPQFSESGHAGRVTLPSGVIDMNSTAKLAEMTLDVEPVGALSATTNGATMLVSDGDGRIWYYTSTAVDGNREQSTAIEYTLAHKVWGGSYAGFANGLMLAAVDWEDDGDLDCLCGTAAGKLMLLRDPKVGRPTNLKAEAGVDNVLLAWDPNEQSRVRGYKVYRAEGDSNRQQSTADDSTAVGSAREVSTATDYALLAAPTLPTYRDTGLATGVYGYKVSALSRFYTAGNSTPTENESVATEPVVATVGGVRFFWNDVVCKVGETASVMLSIENALNYNVAGKTQVVTYDPAYLEPAELIPSELAKNIEYTEERADGQWTITLKSGKLPAGSGKFFTLAFKTLKSGDTTVGEAKVAISSAPTYQLGDVSGDGVVDINDLRLLAKLKSTTGRKYNPDQLKAGDFNGNGKLDNADYQALRALLKERGLL